MYFTLEVKWSENFTKALKLQLGEQYAAQMYLVRA